MKSNLLKRTMSIAVTAAMTLTMTTFTIAKAYDGTTIKTVFSDNEGSSVYAVDGNQTITTVNDGVLRGQVAKVTVHDEQTNSSNYWAAAKINLPEGAIDANDRYVVIGMKVKTETPLSRYIVKDAYDGWLNHFNAGYVGGKVKADGAWHTAYVVYDKASEANYDEKYGDSFTAVDGVQSWSSGFVPSERTKHYELQDMKYITTGFAIDNGNGPEEGQSVNIYIDDVVVYTAETQADYQAIITGQYPGETYGDYIVLGADTTGLAYCNNPASITNQITTENDNVFTRTTIDQHARYAEIAAGGYDGNDPVTMTDTYIKFNFASDTLAKLPAEEYPYIVQRAMIRSNDSITYAYFGRVIDGTRYGINNMPGPGDGLSNTTGYKFGDWNDVYAVYNRLTNEVHFYVNGNEYEYNSNKTEKYTSIEENRKEPSFILSFSRWQGNGQPAEGSNWVVDWDNVQCTIQKDAPVIGYADKLSLIDDATGYNYAGKPASTTVTKNGDYTSYSVDIAKRFAEVSAEIGARTDRNPMVGAYQAYKFDDMAWSTFKGGNYNYIVYGGFVKGDPTYASLYKKNAAGNLVDSSIMQDKVAISSNELWNANEWNSYYVVLDKTAAQGEYYKETDYLNGQVLSTGYRLVPFGTDELRYGFAKWANNDGSSSGIFNVDMKNTELYFSKTFDESQIPVPQPPVTPEFKFESELDYESAPTEMYDYVMEGVYTFKVTASNTLQEDKTVCAILAFYDEDGALIAVKYTAQTVKSGQENEEIVAEYEVEDAENFSYIKTFVWDENMSPLKNN